MLTLAGDSPEKAAKEAADVMEIETALASLDQPHRLAANRRITTHLHSGRFSKAGARFRFQYLLLRCEIRHFDTLNVATPNFFKAVNDLTKSEPVDAWKSYFRWHVIHGTATNLPKAFFDENSHSS